VSKPRQPKPVKQPTPPSGILPFGRFLGNDSWRNFAKLGEDYLQASKMLNDGFKSAPKWPTFQAAFQALEHFLKAYLLLNGATLDHLQHGIGHKLQDALSEAKAKGLILKVDPSVEEAVMKVSEYYTDTQFRYTGSGEWTLVSPHLVITFADQVRRDARL